MKRALIALGATAAVLAVLRPLEPYSWGHSLSASCTWAPRPAAQAFGGEYMDRAANAAELACWRRHGARAFFGDVETILPKWPTEAQLAAWNGDAR